MREKEGDGSCGLLVGKSTFIGVLHGSQRQTDRFGWTLTKILVRLGVKLRKNCFCEDFL